MIPVLAIVDRVHPDPSYIGFGITFIAIVIALIFAFRKKDSDPN